MKLETRVELAVLLVGAVVVGGWVGLRMARKSVRRTKAPPAAQTRAGNASEHIPTAPPAKPPPPAPSTSERKEAAERVKPLPVRIEVASRSDSEKRGPATGDKPRAVIARALDQVRHPDMEAAVKLLDAGKKFEARAMLTQLILATPDGPVREKIKKMLDAINAELFFSRAPSPDAKFYRVKKGDSLSGIVKKFGKDYYFSALVMQINNIRSPKKLQINQRLKIPQGTFSARVRKSAYRLTIFLNGHYIKEYPIGIGARSSPTPVATFAVANNKQVNPHWTAPDGHVYKFGEPGNILGTRWIGFVETDRHQGLGIHGTNDAGSIRKNVSNGCIRMLNKDIEEIFGMLMPGDTVKVVE